MRHLINIVLGSARGANENKNREANMALDDAYDSHTTLKAINLNTNIREKFKWEQAELELNEVQREPTEQEILDVLAEECAEVIQIISKIRRFGIDDIAPWEGAKSNRERLRDEVLDVLAMVRWLELRDTITCTGEEIATATKLKHDKVKRYLRD